MSIVADKGEQIGERGSEEEGDVGEGCTIVE